MTFVVAIDGPAGTGKSSVARLVAQKLNFIYVDTGAIYRGLALLSANHQVEPDDTVALVKLISQLDVRVDASACSTRIFIDGVEVDHELRTERISKLSSMVSQHQAVRACLLSVQRDLLSHISTGAVFEGRDIGTIVFPKAPLKIFITANSKTRAQRRFDEIQKNNGKATFDEILDSIEKRDDRDKNRATAPMQKAVDAEVIDTSAMTIDEVMDQTLKLIVLAQKKSQSGAKLW